MGLWEKVFAAGYDRFMAGTEKAGLHDMRRELLASARGRTLELGAGTGANVELYPAAVTELVLAEPAEPMAKRLEAKHPHATVVRAPAEELPFEDHSFDTVVSTLVLCTVVDPERTLAEVERVLKPDGQLLFLEHILDPSGRWQAWQHRLTPLQKRWACGCHLDRATPDTITGRGFAMRRLEHGQMPKAPPMLKPMAIGVATPPSARTQTAPSSTQVPA
jgi:ubiquinone/menaquinone biosynthesis C-methylase UbiE